MELVEIYKEQHDWYGWKEKFNNIVPLETEFSFSVAWELLEQGKIVGLKDEYDKYGFCFELVDSIGNRGASKKLLVWSGIDGSVEHSEIKQMSIEHLVRSDWILIE